MRINLRSMFMTLLIGICHSSLSPINMGDKGLHTAYLKKVYEHFLVNNKPLNMSSLTRMYSIHS